VAGLPVHPGWATLGVGPQRRNDPLAVVRALKSPAAGDASVDTAFNPSYTRIHRTRCEHGRVRRTRVGQVVLW
jgi:hypothetical protein